MATTYGSYFESLGKRTPVRTPTALKIVNLS
jgi:hypothetical protein